MINEMYPSLVASTKYIAYWLYGGYPKFTKLAPSHSHEEPDVAV
jgi:hypothetical protein